MTEKQPASCYGLCQVQQLPTFYREAFENGTAHQGATLFVRTDHSLLVFSIFAVVFFGLAGMFVAAFVSVRPVFPLRSGASIVGPAIVFGFFLVAFVAGLWSLREWIRGVSIRQQEKSGRYHYGLRLDEQALVIRYRARTSGDTCLYLPRRHIKSVAVTGDPWLNGNREARAAKVFTYYLDLIDTQKETFRIPGKYLNPSETQQVEAALPEVVHESDRRAAHIVMQLLLKSTGVGMGKQIA